MTNKNRTIKIGVASEDQVYQEFIDMWHRAQTEVISEPEISLYFADAATFSKILSKDRVVLLKALYGNGTSSIRNLSQILKRDYKNVCDDVQFLIKAGLIAEDDENRISFEPRESI